MQMQRRALVRIIYTNFDVLPADIADAGAQGFGDRLFARQPRGQPVGHVLAVGALTGGEKTVQEAFTGASDAVLDTVMLNHVDATAQHVILSS